MFMKGLILAVTALFFMTIFGQGISDLPQNTIISNDYLVNVDPIKKNAHFIQSPSESTNSTELVDQSNGGGGGCGGCSNSGEILMTKGVYVAQSFIPSQTSLSKISVYITRLGSTPSEVVLTLSVRESLHGEDLVAADAIADAGFIDFDFEDIEVNTGDMYYMICRTESTSSSNNGYAWFYSAEDSYSKGTSYSSDDDQSWQESDIRDMFFQTYWRDYAPVKPSIDGIHNGQAQKWHTYTFSSVDPEGNAVSYFIDWGDGRSWNWFGPFDSGEEVSKKHQWAKDGEYTIRVKAKDSYGVVSDWSDPFPITMPKNRINQNPFFIFLQDYPYLFLLIQQLMDIYQ